MDKIMNKKSRKIEHSNTLGYLSVVGFLLLTQESDNFV